MAKSSKYDPRYDPKRCDEQNRDIKGLQTQLSSLNPKIEETHRLVLEIPKVREQIKGFRWIFGGVGSVLFALFIAMIVPSYQSSSHNDERLKFLNKQTEANEARIDVLKNDYRDDLEELKAQMRLFSDEFRSELGLIHKELQQGKNDKIIQEIRSDRVWPFELKADDPIFNTNADKNRMLAAVKAGRYILPRYFGNIVKGIDEGYLLEDYPEAYKEKVKTEVLAMGNTWARILDKGRVYYYPIGELSELYSGKRTLFVFYEEYEKETSVGCREETARLAP